MSGGAGIPPSPAGNNPGASGRRPGLPFARAKEAESGLGEPQQGLVNVRIPGDDRTHARSAAAESLGDRVRHDHPVLDIREFENAFVDRTVINELLIDLVADQEQAVFLDNPATLASSSAVYTVPWDCWASRARWLESGE